jgi:hypothetical protein
MRKQRERDYSQHLLTSLPWDNWYRTSSRNDPLQILPSAPDTTAVLLQQLLERNTHLLLDNTWVVDVSGDTEQLGPAVPLASESGKPATASTSDRGGDSDGLDVGYGGRTAEETDIGGEWGLETGLALLPLQRLDESGLFSADVSAGTSVEVDVKVVARAAGVLADKARLVRLVDRLLDVSGLLVEFSSDVDVGCESA